MFSTLPVPYLPNCVSLLLLVPLVGAGCGDPIDLGNQVVWHADHEVGDTSEWTTREDEGQVLLNASVSEEHAHSGSWSLRIEPAAEPTIGAGFDFNELSEAYFSAWYFVPEANAAIHQWPILGFWSKGEDCTGPNGMCAGVDVNLRSLPSSDVLLYLFNSEPDVLQPPLSNPALHIPIARWFQVEVRFKRSTEHTGFVRVWVDGKPVYSYDGWRTAEHGNLFWGIQSPPEGDGSDAPVIFVDDAAISRIAVTPSGDLE